MNQNKALIEIRDFYTKLGAKDIHQNFNYTRVNLDKTHRRGLKCIDSIAASLNMLKCIEESKLLEINDGYRLLVMHN